MIRTMIGVFLLSIMSSVMCQDDLCSMITCEDREYCRYVGGNTPFCAACDMGCDGCTGPTAFHCKACRDGYGWAEDGCSPLHVPPKPERPRLVSVRATNVTIGAWVRYPVFVTVHAYRIVVHFLTNVSRDHFDRDSTPGYVTAELAAPLVFGGFEFTIGDGKKYGQYVNEPLVSNSYYEIRLVAVTDRDNETSSFTTSQAVAVLTVPYKTDMQPKFPLSLGVRETRCLNLSWQIPTSVADSITSFDITATTVGDGTYRSVSRLIPRTAQTFRQCNLEPFTPYVLQVIAFLEGPVIFGTSANTFVTFHETPPAMQPPVLIGSSPHTLLLGLTPAPHRFAPPTAYQFWVEQVGAPRRRKRSSGVGHWGPARRAETETRLGAGYKQAESWTGSRSKDGSHVLFYSLETSKRSANQFYSAASHTAPHHTRSMRATSHTAPHHTRTRRATSHTAPHPSQPHESAMPGYITGQVAAPAIRDNPTFVVGDENTYGGYLNKALTPELWYNVHCVVVSHWFRVSKTNASSLARPAQAVVLGSAPRNTRNAERGDTSREIYLNVVRTVVLCVLILLHVILLLALILLWIDASRQEEKQKT